MDYQGLSKEISYALRHAPWKYELIMDDEGWVAIEDLLVALRRNPKWSQVQADDIIKMIDESGKKRHEVVANRIRAYYGHSTPTKILKTPIEPPEILYHGTTRQNLSKIMNEGLKSCTRQYVHLSQDTDTAYLVGKRRDDFPVLLIINARAANVEGVRFYFGNDKIWLSDDIPAAYIVPLKERSDILTTPELEKEVKGQILSVLPDEIFSGIHFCTGGPNSSEGMYIFSTHDEYHIVSTNEKGKAGKHIQSSALSEVLWIVLKFIIWRIAFKHAKENQVIGQDPRRIMFAKEIELFSKFGDEFGKRIDEEINQVLKEHPYVDQ